MKAKERMRGVLEERRHTLGPEHYLTEDPARILSEWQELPEYLDRSDARNVWADLNEDARTIGFGI